MVVFLLMSGVATPPSVSMESVSGVTSRRRTSPAPSSPASFPPCTAAPRATHSSGFRVLEGSFPVILFTFSCSQVVSRNDFRLAVFTAAAQTRRHVRILHQLTQPADHPVSIYHPEGEYLKGLVLEVE